ncbi:MAG: tetratricopeptide repeat protein, partial [Bacteroidota bacterium]
MFDFAYQDFEAYLATHWGVALAVAMAMAGLTSGAGSLLHPDRRAAIGLWLAGAESEETWAKTFVSLFDAAFGARHLSLSCFLRSAVASLIGVAGIWALMGEAGTFALRLETELSLGAAILIALGVNVMADYLSLLETRWLLGQMHQIRATWAQALVLVADALISGAIIWAAIALYVASPLYEGEIDSFPEILGVFSIFSVAFYSTFLTSIWTWTYILTTWLMRLCTRLNLGYWVDWEKKPVAILSAVLASVSFAVTLAASVPLQRDAEGLSLVDRALCTVFKGPVCLDVQRLTPSEQARLEFLLFACQGGLIEECLLRGTAGWKTAPAEAARLFRVACDGGSAGGCTFLGYLHQEGLGVAEDAEAAARLYRQGCDGGNAGGCTFLGYLHQEGLGVAEDAEAGARLYRQGCDGGNADGCTRLGYLHQEGLGVAELG